MSGLCEGCQGTVCELHQSVLLKCVKRGVGLTCFDTIVHLDHCRKARAGRGDTAGSNEDKRFRVKVLRGTSTVCLGSFANLP